MEITGQMRSVGLIIFHHLDIIFVEFLCVAITQACQDT
jgi:hypothetical protein